MLRVTEQKPRDLSWRVVDRKGIIHEMLTQRVDVFNCECQITKIAACSEFFELRVASRFDLGHFTTVSHEKTIVKDPCIFS